MRTETQGEVVKWGFLKKEQARNMISKHGRKRGQGNKRKSLGISSEKRGTGTSSPFIYPPPPPTPPSSSCENHKRRKERLERDERAKNENHIQSSKEPKTTRHHHTQHAK